MVGLGTLINVGAIIAGGLIGLVGGRLLKPDHQDTILKCNGVAVIVIGISGTLSKMLVIDNNRIVTQGTMMMILSLMLGTVLGSIMDIDQKVENFGGWLQKKSGSQGDNRFINGFATASLTVSVGAMAIIGAIQDGIYGDFTILAAKAVLDFVIVLVMTSSMGKGCIFSSISVGVIQGSFTVLARVIQPIMTETALDNISLVGNILILCVGINLIWPKTIKVANMLPSLIFAVIAAFLPFF